MHGAYRLIGLLYLLGYARGDLFKLSSNGGALSIYHGGKWGIVCATKFPSNGVAGSICQRMGHLSSGFKIDGTLVDVSQITVDQFSCTSSSLDSCTLTPSNGNSQCPKAIGNKATAISLTCTTPTNVHLLPKYSKHAEGIVEIFQANKKGYVCRDSDDNAQKVANVVCRQMGYGGGTPLSDSTIPAGYSGKYFDVTCTGSESSLDACTVKERTSSCTKVGRVECSLNTASQKTFDIRLSKVSKPSMGSGTVEVYNYGRWGVICDTGWDINDAHVVCRQLGYKEAVAGTGAPTKAKFGQGTGLVFWNNVQCTGDELSIEECKHDVVLGTGSCNSVDAAGVVCSSDKLTRNQLSISDPSTVMTIPAGFSFLQSPGFPNSFTYQPYTTYSVAATGLTAGTTIAAYVNLKNFQGNHIEYLMFDNGTTTTELYGDDSFSGPFTSNSDTFKIIFNSSTSNGQGKFNIMLKASAEVSLTVSKGVGKLTTSTTGATSPYAYSTGSVITGIVTNPAVASVGGSANNPDTGGVAVAIVVTVVVVLLLVFIPGIVLWRLGYIRFGRPVQEPAGDTADLPNGTSMAVRGPRVNSQDEEYVDVGDDMYINTAFVHDGTHGSGPEYVNTTLADEQGGSRGTTGPEYVNTTVATERPQAEEMVPELERESPYAGLEPVDRAVYLDLHGLRAQQLQPTKDGRP